MNVDDNNQYLVSGDNDGLLKVFLIDGYCLEDSPALVTEAPRELIAAVVSAQSETCFFAAIFQLLIVSGPLIRTSLAASL